mgnify:CR=1 FL=1
MIQITPQMRILLAVEPVDFRNHSEHLIIPSCGPKGLKSKEFWAAWLIFGRNNQRHLRKAKRSSSGR